MSMIELYDEIPLRVEYLLTELGKSYISVLDSMKELGEQHLGKMH